MAKVSAFSKDDVALALQEYGGIFKHLVGCWKPVGILQESTSATGNFTYSIGSLIFKTGETLGAYARAELSFSAIVTPTWAKRRRLDMGILLDVLTAQNVHIVSGRSPDQGEANTYRHVGFKVIDNVLYATVADGTTEATLEIATLTESFSRLGLVFTPGVECRFYVDGVDVGAITTNLPSGTTDALRLFWGVIENTEAEDKVLYLEELRIIQEP